MLEPLGLNGAQLAAVTIAIGGGAIVLSHVNDSGFWLANRYLGLTEKQTLQTWTVMETIIGTTGIDIYKTIPVTQQTEADAGYVITGGLALARDPETGAFNGSYHRMRVLGKDRTCITIQAGRHLLEDARRVDERDLLGRERRGRERKQGGHEKGGARTDGHVRMLQG